MVSLNRQRDLIYGDMPFDNQSRNITDETIRENVPLITNSEQPYRQIRTTAFIILHILFMIAFETVIVLYPYLCYDKNISKLCNNHSPYNISLYVHASAYILSIIFDRLYHYYQDLSRLDGYLEFYRKTQNLRRMPLIIISAGNAFLVAMIKLLEDYQSSILPVQPWHCLAILTTIETITILIVLLWYLVVTIKFNKHRSCPDATLDDLLSTFVSPQVFINEIGFRDETYRENVLERQADLIRYLRERNENLARLVQQFKQQTDNRSTTTNTI